jgi:hypothetical protein
MFKGKSMIRGVALVALAALAVLWLLPPEHLHPSLEGRSVVVHRHVIAATAPQAASSVDHGDHGDHGDHDDHGDHSEHSNHSDHSDAQILKTVFESAPRFAPDSPVVTHATSVIASSWRVVGYVALLYEWTCHDPPDLPTSLRAPPA